MSAIVDHSQYSKTQALSKYKDGKKREPGIEIHKRRSTKVGKYNLLSGKCVSRCWA